MPVGGLNKKINKYCLHLSIEHSIKSSKMQVAFLYPHIYLAVALS
jgi:hypothetical protein